MTKNNLDKLQIGKLSHNWAQTSSIETWYQEESTSTNSIAKEDHPESSIKIYFTDYQTAGRGRGENTWLNANRGGALLSSWSYQLPYNPQPIISILIGLCLYRAALATWPFLDWSIKAPNDLYLRDKKVAGLLIETITQGAESKLIIGLGLNVTSSPTNLKSATSLIANLPDSVPLLGEDWIQFLERFLMESTNVLTSQPNELNESQRHAILHALNQNPNLDEDYIDLSPHGSLATDSKTINWFEL